MSGGLQRSAAKPAVDGVEGRDALALRRVDRFRAAHDLPFVGRQARAMGDPNGLVALARIMSRQILTRRSATSEFSPADRNLKAPCLNLRLRMELDPQTLRILGEALDGAWQRVKRNHLNGRAYAPRSVLAQHIYAMAKRGERDPRHLIDVALMRLKL